MSLLTRVNSQSLHGGYRNAGVYHTLTIPSVTSGNTLVITMLRLSGETFTTAPSAWNGTVDVPMVFVTSVTVGSSVWDLYQLDNITTAPTTVRWKLNVANYTYVDVFEIGGTGGVAPTLKLNQKTNLTGASLFTVPFITTTPNEFVIGCWLYGNGGVQTASAPFTQNTHNNYGKDSMYAASIGPAGSYSSQWTSENSSAPSMWLVSFGNSSAPPTVSTVTGNSVTEGTALRFTITLSGTTGANSDYSVAWGGTAVNGTDYDNNLASATYSAGLSFVGGQLRVANGYSGGTIDVTTYDNALDQPDRTLILTVGGVDSTGGLITDNDAPTVVTFTDGVESFGVVTCVATLGAVSGKDVSFQVDTTNGTKTAGTNYTAIVAQTVTIPAGSLTAAITANTL